MRGKVEWVWRTAVLALLCLLAYGCSGFGSGHVKPDTAVKAGPPVVYVHPLGDIGWEIKVGVLPFLVPDNVGQTQGLRVAALFKDVLLGKRVFRTVEQLGAPYGTLQEALDLGRANGLDYVLAGRLGTVFEGSEFGGARVEVSVRLLATATGDTVWYLEQAVNQKIDYPEVGFRARFAAIFSPPPIRSSGAASPVPNMLARVASDMAGVMAGGELR